ncbi:MAG: LysR family transcriptional regulator, partial [Burkholderiales bacterium]|nr:LysR family transcriptional regulator [Burkholderiales bacterium]
MNLHRIDLNLLRVLRTVYATRSASKAGRQLGMTQSAVSNALRRLRLRLDDPLFVRSTDGMLPTALVESIIGPIADGLDRIEAAVSKPRSFDPATSDRLFRILMSDLAQLIFVPRLISHLSATAPDIRFETLEVAPDEGRRAMHEGSIDLVIGNWPAMGSGYYRQRLFSESFVVLMSQKNPLARRRLTKSDYLKARHMDYHPGGATYASLRGMLQKVLAKEKLGRHVTFTAGHALGLAAIAAQSELLLTLPARLASSLVAGRSMLTIKPLPFPMPALTITQQWHARAHHDPANAWLRRQVAAIFAED